MLSGAVSEKHISLTAPSLIVFFLLKLIDLREKHLLIQDSGEILKKLSESECIEGAWNSHQERIFSVSPDDSVLNAISVLNERNIHRLPIILKDPDNTVLCIINHQRILRFLLSKMQAKHSALMKKETIGDLKIGTYGPACPTANRSTKLIDILKLLKTHRVPAIVIVDEAGKYLDAYSRSDVRFLALDKSYDRLDITVEEALADHHSSRVIPTVRAEESLDIVFKRLLGTRKHATVLIDENDKVLGIISLSDIFGYLLSHRKS